MGIKRRDLTGQRFGSLIAVKDIGQTKRYNRLWECECDCGKVVQLPSGTLTTGGTKSCGCRKHRPAHNRLNLVGQRFEKLVVLADAGDKRHGECLWKCQCDCGEITSTTTNSLTSGNTKSCGCYHKERTQALFSKPIDVVGLNFVYGTYKRRADKIKVVFALSKPFLEQLIQAPCYYCGTGPSNRQLRTGRPYIYNGIDRLDNSLGYIPDNVVTCCIRCNKMKKAASRDDFLRHINDIAQRHPML